MDTSSYSGTVEGNGQGETGAGPESGGGVESPPFKPGSGVAYAILSLWKKLALYLVNCTLTVKIGKVMKRSKLLRVLQGTR